MPNSTSLSSNCEYCSRASLFELLNYVIHINDKPLAQIVGKYSVQNPTVDGVWCCFKSKGKPEKLIHPRCLRNAVLCRSHWLMEIFKYLLTKSHSTNTFPSLAESRTLEMDGRGHHLLVFYYRGDDSPPQILEVAVYLCLEVLRTSTHREPHSD